MLGPVLFILYINDLVDVLRAAKGLCFADDTKLTGAIPNETSHRKLQEDLDRVIAWSIKNNMKLHESKFYVLNYRLNATSLLRELPFTADLYHYRTTTGEVIESVPTIRDLGVILSDDCSWSAHIRLTAETAKRMASWVLGAFRDRSELVMTTLFKTMVRSKLEYGLPAWIAVKIEDIEALENVQRYFTKRISSCKGLDYWDRLRKLKLLSLQRRRERFMMIHVWKLYHGKAPNDIDMVFYENMRLGIKARVPRLNTRSERAIVSHYDNSFGIKAAQLWNLLPRTINEIDNLDRLKVALGNFLEAFPDKPPVTGYTRGNTNSLLDLSKGRGERTLAAAVPL